MTTLNEAAALAAAERGLAVVSTHNLSAPTIRGRGWSTASDCGCYSARSSLRRVARTTTGTSTTG